ncbi:MAG: HdeD family acid-resistance protein [bacterium]|nr:HdeD family acid-resistance protein [Candidatus Sumerlaeota bacterium]
MSTETPVVAGSPYRHIPDEVKKGWGWFLALGIVMVILGIAALGMQVALTLTSMIFFGALLVAGGVLEIVAAVRGRGWSGLLFHLLVGILYLVVGLLAIANPVEAATSLTLLIGAAFMVGGFFRIFASLSLRFHNWGWALLSGAIGVLLGLIIWRQWPWSGFYVIGLFIAIVLIFNGWAMVMFALAARCIVRRGSR